MYWICEESSFIRRLFTTSFGLSSPQMRRNFFPLVTTTQIAKEYGCGAKVFNRLLHLHGIQYRANGQWVLYSEHHGKGYTSSLAFRLQRSDGSEVEKLHTAWTQKGRKFLYHTLKRRGVLPLAEQGG